LVASEGVQRDSQSLVNCSRRGASIWVDCRKRVSAITGLGQRHSGDRITSKSGFWTSAATRRARVRRPEESATLRIVNEGPKTRMERTVRRVEGINLKLLSFAGRQ